MFWCMFISYELGASSGAACSDACLALPPIRSTADRLCAGDRWLYLAVIAIVLWPARSWICLIDAPAIASHEQNVWRLECQTYPVISVSARQGVNQERVSNLPLLPSRWNTRSDCRNRGYFREVIAAMALEFKSTVRGLPGLKCASGEERHWTRRAYGTRQEVPT